MNTIEVSPELLLQYIGMNKNAVIVHLTMKAVAQDGKLERNIKTFSKLVHRARDRVRDAEGELKRFGLLCIHRNGGVPYWYVYDRPTRPEAVQTTAVKVVVETENQQKSKSLWQKIKYAFTGDDLDYELTKP
jgi:hypothetical protein